MNNHKPAQRERAEFAERFIRAVTACDSKLLSHTRFTNLFNSVYEGNPITVHAARKWFMAESIPNQDKLRTSAIILGVSPQWLRYGSAAGPAFPASLTESQTMMSIRGMSGKMSDADQALVLGFCRMLKDIRATEKGKMNPVPSKPPDATDKESNDGN